MSAPTSQFVPALPENRSRFWTWFIVGGLFALGLLTRGWNVSTRFDHPDEPITIGMNHSLDHLWDTNWKLASLPSPFNYDQYNFSGYHYVVHAWSKLAGPFLPSAWTGLRDGVVGLRAFSVLCGALAVCWSFFIGRRLGGIALGVAAAVLVLVNPQLVADSHYARSEAMLTWLTLVVVGLALGEEKWDWRARLGISGFLVGFMVATKVTMGLMLVAPIWIAWRQSRTASGTLGQVRRFGLTLLVAAGVVVAGFAAGVPGAVAHPDVFVHGVRILAAQYGGFHEPHSEFGGGRVMLTFAKFYLVTVGLLAAISAAWATFSWVRRREWAGVVLLAAPTFAYGVYFAAKQVFFERNLSHVVPLGLVVSAAGICGLAAALAKLDGWPRRAIVGVALALVAAPGAAVTWPLLTRSLGGEDSQASIRYADEIRAKYAGLEWRPISLIFPDNLARLRREFALGRKPLLVQFQEFNDSYSRHYGETLEQEFVTYDAGMCSETLSYLPCSALVVYHGPRTVFKIVTGKRWTGPTTP